jgi:hypothetical protein
MAATLTISRGSVGMVKTMRSASQVSVNADGNHPLGPAKLNLAEVRHLSSIPLIVEFFHALQSPERPGLDGLAQGGLKSLTITVPMQ